MSYSTAHLAEKVAATQTLIFNGEVKVRAGPVLAMTTVTT